MVVTDGVAVAVAVLMDQTNPGDVVVTIVHVPIHALVLSHQFLSDLVGPETVVHLHQDHDLDHTLTQHHAHLLHTPKSEFSFITFTITRGHCRVLNLYFY